MAELEFIEDPGQDYEVEELSSESGSEYGYASDVIEEIVSHLSPEEQEEYKQLKHFHTRQLIEQKKITPIHHMVDETLSELKIPKKEVAEVLTEAASSTAPAATSGLQTLADVPKLTTGKQIITRVRASDDAFLRKYLNPTVKTEEELKLYPSLPDIEIQDSDDDTEEDDVIRDAKSNLIHALGELEETAAQQVKIYKKLRKNLQYIDAADTETFQEVAEALPGAPSNLPPPVTEYLQSINPRDARRAVSVGHLLLARYNYSKTGEKPPAVEDIAHRYGLSAKEVHEIKRGEAYLGGKQKARKEETAVKEETPTKKRKQSTPVKKAVVPLTRCDAPAAATEPTT